MVSAIPENWITQPELIEMLGKYALLLIDLGNLKEAGTLLEKCLRIW